MLLWLGRLGEGLHELGMVLVPCIAAAASAVGRSPDSVTLVAVTKYVDAEVTSLLVDAGAQVLG